jgi:tetrapyrrole methylase family protein/MazG family protein
VAADRQAFTIADVVEGIAAKMVRRHPHVFGDATARDSAEVLVHWERIKAEEKPTSKRRSIERLPADLSALHRAQRVLDKFPDETTTDAAFASLRASLAGLDAHRDEVERQLGDVLLGVCRLARGLGVEAESALRERTRQLVDDRLADEPGQ